jgi:hypothetical protein
VWRTEKINVVRLGKTDEKVWAFRGGGEVRSDLVLVFVLVRLLVVPF